MGFHTVGLSVPLSPAAGRGGYGWGVPKKTGNLCRHCVFALAADFALMLRWQIPALPPRQADDPCPPGVAVRLVMAMQMPVDMPARA